jgi:hypothetical protein
MQHRYANLNVQGSVLFRTKPDLILSSGDISPDSTSFALHDGGGVQNLLNDGPFITLQELSFPRYRQRFPNIELQSSRIAKVDTNNYLFFQRTRMLFFSFRG